MRPASQSSKVWPGSQWPSARARSNGYLVSFCNIISLVSLLLLANYVSRTSEASSSQHGSIKALNLESINQVSHQELGQGAYSLANHLLNNAQLANSRFKRQASSSSGQSNSNGSADDKQQGGAAGSNDASAQDQADAPEVLASLKCDFGSADAPDLCKFRLLDWDATNPLARSATSLGGASLASWSLGSGRLALFQGGPLLDASGLLTGANETSGGYIFYETSNPFANSNATILPSHQSQAGDPYATFVSPQKPFLASKLHTAHSIHNSLATGAGGQREDHLVISSQRVSINNPLAAAVGSGSGSGQLTLSSNGLQLSHLQQIQAQLAGPSFVSANFSAPGPGGMCLSFQYAIQGLSAEELRVYVNDRKSGHSRQIWASSESAAQNWTKGEVLYSVTSEHALVFSAVSSSAIVKDFQQRKFRGHLALDEIEVQRHDPLGSESCKGHCNFDGDLCGWTQAENGQEDNFDWAFGRGSENLFTGPARDFTSSMNNELTGSYLYTPAGYPRRPGDRATLVSPLFQPTAMNEAMCMRFAVHMFGSGIGSLTIKIRYADDSSPGSAQPTGSANPKGGPQSSSANTSAAAAGQQQAAPTGQQANSGPNQPSASGRLGSDQGQAADQAQYLVVWEMSGDAGNSWHQAQTSVSSSKSPFQVLIEGTIGDNHLGQIAIDEISFSQGPCPTSPPVASKNYGDCTFEQSMCYWRNPDADIHLDDLDWLRQADETSIHGPNFDHTLKKRSGSYLKLENTLREPKSGTRAFLLSPVFQPKASGSVQCLSFYYYMFMRSIGSSGPNLGTIRIYLASNNELVPIWRLTNPISSPNWKHGRASLSNALVDGQRQAPNKLFQIAFEGIWGDAPSGAIALDDITVFDGSCDIMPQEARSVPGECTFDADLCSWSNKSLGYELAPGGQAAQMSAAQLAELDSSRSPFLQSVAGGSAASLLGSRASASLAANHAARSSPTRASSSWQLATVDSRPVNLQDHTYKAPIGYVYIDVLDTASTGSAPSGGAPLAYPLQSMEVSLQSGQQLLQCLSFWFAAYGRQESNLLGVYLTQASAPPLPPEDVASQPTGPRVAAPAASATAAAVAATSGSGSTTAEALAEAEQAIAWKSINGKLIWQVALRNVTDTQRRKWLYGQVTVRAESNHIIRFLAVTNDGGFALDDISYFDGPCETRPSHARVQSAEEEAAELAAAAGGSQDGAPSGQAPGLGQNSANTG